MIQYPKKLKDKITLICKAMQRPYYLMTRLAKGSYMFEIYDGTSEGHIINWSGISPGGAVDDALAYLTHEIEMGVVELPADDNTKEPASTTVELDAKSTKDVKAPEKIVKQRVTRRNKKK